MVDISTRVEERNRQWLKLVFDKHVLSTTKLKSKCGNKSIHPLIVMRRAPSDGQENMRDEGGHFSHIPWLPIMRERPDVKGRWDEIEAQCFETIQAFFCFPKFFSMLLSKFNSSSLCDFYQPLYLYQCLFKTKKIIKTLDISS